VLDSITSRLVGVSSQDFFQSKPCETGMTKWVQFLQCPPPKICDSQKIVQNFSRFLTTFDFDREYLRKGSTYQKSEKLLIVYNPSHVGWKKVGVLRSTNEKVIDSKYIYTIMDFLRDYISSIRGCCTLKLLHMLELTKAY